MNAPAFAADSVPTAAYVNPPFAVSGLLGSLKDTPEYRTMVKSLYFPPMPEITWDD